MIFQLYEKENALYGCFLMPRVARRHPLLMHQEFQKIATHIAYRWKNPFSVIVLHLKIKRNTCPITYSFSNEWTKVSSINLNDQHRNSKDTFRSFKGTNASLVKLLAKLHTQHTPILILSYLWTEGMVEPRGQIMPTTLLLAPPPQIFRTSDIPVP